MAIEPIVFERGDHVYLVGPAMPVEFDDSQVQEFAFGKDVLTDLRNQAPNPMIAWFSGHYVEGDTPNGNGAMWSSGELAIKSLTPMLMPCTVMHDMRTAVGLIADVKLKTPDADGVPRSKIETAIALWRHRFPDVYEEAVENYRRGTLAQSMECLAPRYECGECGMGYMKLPRGAERANWCSHLRGDGNQPPVRKLLDTVFTGTGLIFGTRGASPADPKAQLEAVQDEVAEFHQRVHADTARPRRKRTMETVEITKTEYAELQGRPTRQEFDDERARAEKAERDLEAAETAKVAAETEKANLQKQVDEANETARQATLRDDRLGSLGEGFLAALGEKTKDRLRTQAGTFSDDDWTARLEELEELSGKKRDLGKKDAGGNDNEFTANEVARFQAGGGNDNNGHEPSPVARRSVLGGLTK